MNTLHHLALGTSDVERLARFYRDVLGLRELARNLCPDGSVRSVWLELGGAALMIESTHEAPRVVTGVAPGLFLLALAVAEGERSALESRLEQAGSAIESRSEWTSYLRDPDGNRVALSSYPLPPPRMG